MPISSQTTQIVPQRQAPRDITVRSWPLAERSRAAWGVMLAVGTGSVASGVWCGSVATALVFGAVGLLAGWKFLAPLEFELTAMGITRATLWSTRRIPWSVVGRIERRSHGVLVFPSVEPVALEALQALYLPFGKQETDILSLLDFYLSGRATYDSTSHAANRP
jgi:hypothetical protein